MPRLIYLFNFDSNFQSCFHMIKIHAGANKTRVQIHLSHLQSWNFAPVCLLALVCIHHWTENPKSKRTSCELEGIYALFGSYTVNFFLFFLWCVPTQLNETISNNYQVLIDIII